jgi:hypothetical protein
MIYGVWDCAIACDRYRRSIGCRPFPDGWMSVYEAGVNEENSGSIIMDLINIHTTPASTPQDGDICLINDHRNIVSMSTYHQGNIIIFTEKLVKIPISRMSHKILGFYRY